MLELRTVVQLSCGMLAQDKDGFKFITNVGSYVSPQDLLEAIHGRLVKLDYEKIFLEKAVAALISSEDAKESKAESKKGRRR